MRCLVLDRWRSVLVSKLLASFMPHVAFVALSWLMGGI